MGYAEDVDVVREYVRTVGRSDYLRMYEVASQCVTLEFAFNVDEHAADLAAAVADPAHVRVLAGRRRPEQLSELATQYWAPLQDSVFALSDQLANVYEVAFCYDEDGPYLGVGIWPLTEEGRARVASAFTPHRVLIHQQGPVTPV